MVRKVGYRKQSTVSPLDDLPTPQFVAQGFLKGFLLWFIPVVVIRRNTKALPRALALGTFAAVVRAQLRLKDKFKDKFKGERKALQEPANN